MASGHCYPAKSECACDDDACACDDERDDDACDSGTALLIMDAIMSVRVLMSECARHHNARPDHESDDEFVNVHECACKALAALG